MFHYSNTETLEMSGKALKKKHCTKLAFQAGRAGFNPWPDLYTQGLTIIEEKELPLH
jgi:hypothetical protein